MKKRKHTTTQVYGEESRLFYIVILSFVCAVMLYMYFVSLSVVHVVMRKEADTEMVKLMTSVGELEAEYIQGQHALSSDIATHRGFVLAERKIFIDKSADTLVLRNE